MRIILINTKSTSMKNVVPPRTALTPIAVGALLLAAGSAFAQTADETAAQAPVPTVVVTASADASAQGLSPAYAGGQVARGGRLGMLGNVDIMDSPFNSTNFTMSLIQAQQAKGVADVLQNDPSVRVARGFGNFQELYVIRGFPVNSDDIAYNGLYGLLPRQFVASELLERVEVLRGANSFVNGAAPGGGNIGGSVNLVPKRAPNAPLNQITVGVDSGGQGYVAADVARRLGEGDRLGVRINAVRRDGDTAVDNENRKLTVFSVGMDYRGDNYRLSADIGHQDHQLRDPRPSVTAGAGLPIPSAPDADKNFGQSWTRSQERDTFGTVRAEVDLAPNVVGWAAFGMRSGHEFNSLASPTTFNTAGDTSAYRFDNVRDDVDRTGEIGLRGTLATGAVKHTISASASTFGGRSKNAYALSDFSGFTSNLYRPVDAAMPPATFYTGGAMDNPLLTNKIILGSYALADTLSMLDDSVHLTVGLRHQMLKNVSYDYNSGAEQTRYDRSANTPVVGIAYRPIKSVSVYANYAEALQPGPVAAGTQILNQGQIFEPTVSRQKEVGVKYDGGKLGGSIAFFTTSQPLGNVQNRVFGVFGSQKNQGIELSVFGMPMHGLRVLGGLNLLDTEQRDTGNAATEGKDAIGVPRTQLNLGVDWDVPGVPGLALDARTLYTSHQYADATSTQQLPSWTRLDLGASYTTRVMDRDVTLRARVDNVTDRAYWASAGGYPGYGYLVLGAPRTFGLTATVDF
jgi:iron complex outermembrane receptor protein